MLPIETIKPGNLILFDHKQNQTPPNPCIRGIVDYVQNENVIMKGGFKAKIETCAGIPLDESWFNFYGQKSKHYPSLKFVHELQNFYAEKTNKQLVMVNPMV